MDRLLESFVNAEHEFFTLIIVVALIGVLFLGLTIDFFTNIWQELLNHAIMSAVIVAIIAKFAKK